MSEDNEQTPQSDMEELAAHTFNLRVSTLVQAKAREANLRETAIAELLGITEKQVRRKFRGESGFSVKDLMVLSIRLGVDVVPHAENRDQLFPEEIRPRLIWTDTKQGSSVVIRDPEDSTSSIDWNSLVPIVAECFLADSAVPHRLATGGDLRRHVLGGLISLGVPESRIFKGPTEATLAIGLGSQLIVECFASCARHETAERVEDEILRITERVQRMTGIAPSVLLIAALTPELFDAIAFLGVAANATGSLELPDSGSGMSVRAMAKHGDLQFVAFELVSVATQSSIEV
jgi:AraC-like DNA-binding protein